MKRGDICDIYEKKEYIETFYSLLYYDINNVAKMRRDYLISCRRY